MDTGGWAFCSREYSEYGDAPVVFLNISVRVYLNFVNESFYLNVSCKLYNENSR